ncbi:MAG TPA: sigma-70 family RNA polymerase sigma factor [Candidatus Dormibacteraeota bacterium]
MTPADGSTPLHVVHAEPQAPDWEAVYREHVGPLYRFVYARTGNRADAEDITSATFVRALPRLHAGVSDAELRAYLRATARTVIADTWRERHGTVLEEIHEESIPNHDVAVESHADVAPLLDRLPGNYRTVLELRFLRGYSVRETAAAMGISVSNAKVMQLRALRRAAQLEPPS